MKTYYLILSAFLMGCSTGAYAQADTTGASRLDPKRARTLQHPAPPKTTTPAMRTDKYASPNNVMIHQDDLPATMRETLRHSQYKGWENSTIYQDKTSGEYSVEINNGSTTTPQHYRFDRNGRPIQQVSPAKTGVDGNQ
jgi:hypothetical protein